MDAINSFHPYPRWSSLIGTESRIPLEPRDIIGQFEEKIPNSHMNTTSRRVAKDLIEAIKEMADRMPVGRCRGMSASAQGCNAPGSGVQHPASADPADAGGGVQDSALHLALPREGLFYTMMIRTVLVVTWMLNDVFAPGQDRRLAAGNRIATVDLAVRVFLEAIEMDSMARRFPRAIFAIGVDARTWGVDQSFYSTAARIGVVLTGRNVASGMCDHQTLQRWRRTDGWRYMKSRNHDAAKALVAFLVRDVKYVLMITSGARNLPRNYARFGMGVGLRAADSEGTRLMSSEAHGVGNQNTGISPPLWSPAHGPAAPPQAWHRSFDTNILKQTVDGPVDVPWGLVPAMKCAPDSIALRHVDPAFDDPRPRWLTNLGLGEMMRKSAQAGVDTIMTGIDQTSQISDPSLGAYYLAKKHETSGSYPALWRPSSWSKSNRRTILCGPSWLLCRSITSSTRTSPGSQRSRGVQYSSKSTYCPTI
jgi:hypothetical protein